MKKYSTQIIVVAIILVALVGIWFYVLGGDTSVAATTADGSFTVTLSVRCDTLLDNMHMLDREKHELVPADGVIFPETLVIVNENENVFDVLQREMRNAGIHMAFRWTPVFDSVYIEAINNLYEFDAGPLSGWMYRVNNGIPGFGASMYALEPGDKIEWLYTIDLGRDLEESGFSNG